MAPTLREQDILHVFPINDRSVQSGDVISFITSKNSRIISHRVVSGNPFRLKTKGDNSTTFDTQYVDPKNIIGIVKYVKRNGKTRRIRGGMAGRTAAMKLGMMLRIRRVIIHVLRPFFTLADRTGIFKRFLSRFLKTRIFRFDHPGGMELRLLSGNRVIGRLAPGNSDWHIKGLYKLCIDNKNLPNNTGDAET